MSKLVSLGEALSRFVPDGSSVVMGAGLEASIPFAAGYELVRQKLLVPVLARRRLRPVVGGVVAVLVVGFGHFCWVTLVQRELEYQIAYPMSRHVLDWSNRDGRGIGGVFGAVHHHGWKALGVMMADGEFPGGYTTNESPAIAAWYLRELYKRMFARA